MAVALFSVYNTLIESFAEINYRSIALLKASRTTAAATDLTGRAGCRMIVGRELKCLTDLRIRGGATFYFDEASSLTFLEIILVQSVNLFMMKYPS